MCEKNKVKEINIIWIIIESSEWKNRNEYSCQK